MQLTAEQTQHRGVPSLALLLQAQRPVDAQHVLTSIPVLRFWNLPHRCRLGRGPSAQGQGRVIASSVPDRCLPHPHPQYRPWRQHPPPRAAEETERRGTWERGQLKVTHGICSFPFVSQGPGLQERCWPHAMGTTGGRPPWLGLSPARQTPSVLAATVAPTGSFQRFSD